MDTQFLRVNHDGTTSYELIVTGAYLEPRPEIFNVEIFGLEEIANSPLQVTGIGKESYILVIPEVRLRSGRFHITAEANADGLIAEQRQDNNLSKPHELDVYEPVTASAAEFEYFAKAVSKKIHKFRDKAPVYVQFFGSADKSVEPSLESIRKFKEGAADIEEATHGNLSFRYTTPPAQAPILEVFFDIPDSELRTLFPDFPQWTLDEAGGLWDWLELTSDSYLQRARFAMVSERPNGVVSRQWRNFIILHELINVSGAQVDQDGPLDSALSEAPRRSILEAPQRYSPLDLKVLEILYSPFVEPYTSPDQIKDRLVIENN